MFRRIFLQKLEAGGRSLTEDEKDFIEQGRQQAPGIEPSVLGHLRAGSF
jgi:hypothetical protein